MTKSVQQLRGLASKRISSRTRRMNGRGSKPSYYLAKCLQSCSQFLSFLFSFAVTVEVYVLYKAHVLQMEIYDVHRGREMGGVRRKGGVETEEEEVLKRGRKQLPLV